MASKSKSQIYKSLLHEPEDNDEESVETVLSSFFKESSGFSRASAPLSLSDEEEENDSSGKEDEPNDEIVEEDKVQEVQRSIVSPKKRKSFEPELDEEFQNKTLKRFDVWGDDDLDTKFFHSILDPLKSLKKGNRSKCKLELLQVLDKYIQKEEGPGD